MTDFSTPTLHPALAAAFTMMAGPSTFHAITQEGFDDRMGYAKETATVLFWD